MSYTLVISTLAALVSCVVCGNDCSRSESFAWRGDPTNCQDFYMCIAGQKLKYTCPQGTVADVVQRTCVRKGSKYDTCSELNDESKLQINDCKAGEKTSIDENCAKYMVCERNKNGSLAWEEMECPYPFLYDSKSNKCSHYSVVDCGQRYAPKGPCDYEANQCIRSHCIPCSARHPTCNGLPDGTNKWTGREWSPYYVVCHEERVTFQGECDHSAKKNEVFHPDKKTCVEYDEKMAEYTFG